MSYNIGLSGLRSTNQALNVISQNIANVSTAGFKAARAEYAALYAGGEPGGVEVAQVSQDFSKDGSKEFTGRSLDLAISGQGFFMVKNAQGQTAYTRAGTFNKDASNFIVGAGGEKLQGYGVDANGALLTGVVTDLKISASNLAAKASTRLDFKANLRADAAVPATTPFDPADANSFNYSYTSSVYDSLGTEHTVTQYFVKTGANTWDSNYYVDGAATGVTQAVNFNTDGTLAAPTTPVVLNMTPAGADPIALDVSYTGTTQYAADFSASYDADGYSSGELAGVRVDDDGSVFAVFTNGKDLLQGKVALANFSNPNGLAKGDNTSWTATFSSGNAVIGDPGAGGLGTLTAGAYEGSNVDLTGELVNLMTAQRNYQANAKSISTADKMTQVLFSSW
ncbi:flagellar hook protein FlgE [Gallaecimonas xiamenensis]|uniref:Flagellar hook protein FlgE n=1 Tax=Gallaecimonas xiamenensis 3-C-1 TaxID=745411 RepID=K2IUI9_9GAMM|nr:flagellar hook protein FlgE [Gallaecimonas xiamenensis]EKE73976.1 flagellar hook protein FlgE [Gallaecimonas xiamenensis 3-C-1]